MTDTPVTEQYYYAVYALADGDLAHRAETRTFCDELDATLCATPEEARRAIARLARKYRCHVKQAHAPLHSSVQVAVSKHAAVWARGYIKRTDPNPYMLSSPYSLEEARAKLRDRRLLVPR